MLNTGSRPGSTRALFMGGSPASGSIRPSFGTHSLRRTKAVLIYRGLETCAQCSSSSVHSKIESNVRYLASKSTMRSRSRRRSTSEDCFALRERT
ncbi:MAG: hypothetical protein WDN31_14030 [Hyphomicrobium sp.]